MIRNVSRFRGIRLQQAGDGVERQALDRLAEKLAAYFRTPCRVDPGAVPIHFAFDAVRSQYHSTAILQRLALLAEDEEGIRLVGVAEADLFVPVLTFVFGEAQLNGRCALVSLRRLREEFYGLPGRADLLEERLLKESVHELGHTFGLRHCSDWRCVMASTHAVERLDLKEPRFCVACSRLIPTLH